jgi:hypothetical protein
MANQVALTVGYLRTTDPLLTIFDDGPRRAWLIDSTLALINDDARRAHLRGCTADKPSKQLKACTFAAVRQMLLVIYSDGLTRKGLSHVVRRVMGSPEYRAQVPIWMETGLSF